MNGRSPFAPVKQLIRDTFRQAWASGITWMMLAGTAVCVMLCLSVHVSGDLTLQAKDEQGYFLSPPSQAVLVSSWAPVVASSGTLERLTLTMAGYKLWDKLNPANALREGIPTIRGRMTLAFGAVSFPVVRERGDAVHFIELILAGGVAGTLGVLLALVWTAGFVPTFLEPSAAAVLLAKPVARWQLLLGKYLGVLTFLGVQVVLFIVLTWFALGVRTQVWDMTYWWCIPLLLLQFAIFYSFSILLAVVTRSTAACVVGSLLFWLLAWGINYGSVMVRNLPAEQSLPAFTRILTETGYWISPKPIDAGLILFNALHAQEHFEKPAVFKLLESGQGFSPQLSILSCLAISVVLLALSAYEFTETDY